MIHTHIFICLGASLAAQVWGWDWWVPPSPVEESCQSWAAAPRPSWCVGLRIQIACTSMASRLCTLSSTTKPVNGNEMKFAWMDRTDGRVKDTSALQSCGYLFFWLWGFAVTWLCSVTCIPSQLSVQINRQMCTCALLVLWQVIFHCGSIIARSLATRGADALLLSRSWWDLCPWPRGLTMVDLFWCLNVYADILVPRGVQTPVDVLSQHFVLRSVLQQTPIIFDRSEQLWVTGGDRLIRASTTKHSQFWALHVSSKFWGSFLVRQLFGGVPSREVEEQTRKRRKKDSTSRKLTISLPLSDVICR